MTTETTRISRGRHREGGNRHMVKPIVAGVTTLTLGLSGAFLTGGAAFAAPGSSEASARYLSGALLERSLDDVAAIAGEEAVAGADTDEVVTNSGNLELSAFGNLVNLQVADGIVVPLSITDAGAVSQYAQASQNGASRAASGLVTNDGVIDVDATDAAPGSLSLDLTDLIGDDLTDSVANLTLNTGINSASANSTGSTQATGDYRIGDLSATFTSPALTDLSTRVLTAGDGVETAVNGALGQDGSLVSGITDAVSSLGVATVTSSVDVDLDPVLQDVLAANAVLGADGPVQVDVQSGLVTVDIQALLEANGRDLNDLQPGEDILTPELVAFITADVDELVNGLLDEAQEAVTTTLAATDVNVSAVVGDQAAPDLTLTLAGTVAEITDGVAVTEITVADTTFDVAPLNALVAATIDGVLNAQLNTEAIDAPLSASYPELGAVLTSLVRLQANVQTVATGIFTETALRLTVLNAVAGTQAAEVNFAQAAVGPNVLPTDSVLDFTPGSGPETGGTEVVITGEGFTDAPVTQVIFGNVPGTNVRVISDTEIRVISPAGTGAVTIGVEQGSTLTTSSEVFVYVPAPTVLSVTPNVGPEAGGTTVTIRGTDFDGATNVTFGGVPATSVTYISPTELTAVTPAGVGTVDVAVVKSVDVFGALAGGFTYVPANTPGGETPAPGDGGTTPGNNNPAAGGEPTVIPDGTDGNGNTGGAGGAPNTGVVGEGVYENCDAAAAAGVSNFATTDRNLDGDNDGVGCETDAAPNTNQNLAFTGSDSAKAGIVGAALLLMSGIGAMLFARKKKLA